MSGRRAGREIAEEAYRHISRNTSVITTQLLLTIHMDSVAIFGLVVCTTGQFQTNEDGEKYHVVRSRAPVVNNFPFLPLQQTIFSFWKQ